MRTAAAGMAVSTIPKKINKQKTLRIRFPPANIEAAVYGGADLLKSLKYIFRHKIVI